MTVRRRGNRWTAEVYDPSRARKKRYAGTYSTQREARDAARRAESDVARRRGRPDDETVASWAARWLELRPRQKEATNVAYREQVRPFVARHGAKRLRDVDVELALQWLGEERWTHGGVRALFSDARRAGLVESNPFVGLRLRGSAGRRDLVPLTVAEVTTLAACAPQVRTGEVALTVEALICMAAFVGMRPGELYGLRWDDLDLASDEVHVRRQYSPQSGRFELPKNGRARTVRRQYSPQSGRFELPKNGRARTVVLTPPARAALLAMPRALRGDELVFRTSRGKPMTGRVQHYYWHPVRCRFGRPSMDFYELRHFCAAWLFNDLALPAQDVAHQLGHTDGGALVQRLYGHPSERLARERIKRATGGKLAEVVDLAEAERRQAT